MKPTNRTALGRLAQLDVMDAKELARLRREFITDLENCELVPDFRSDHYFRSSYVDLFWSYYLLHLIQSRCLKDDVRQFTHSLMSLIVEELNRRDYVDFLLFSDDLPE